MTLRRLQRGVGCRTAAFDQQGRWQASYKAVGFPGGPLTSGHAAQRSSQRVGLDEPRSADWPTGSLRSAAGSAGQTPGQAAQKRGYCRSSSSCLR